MRSYHLVSSESWKDNEIFDNFDLYFQDLYEDVMDEAKTVIDFMRPDGSAAYTVELSQDNDISVKQAAQGWFESGGYLSILDKFSDINHTIYLITQDDEPRLEL